MTEPNHTTPEDPEFRTEAEELDALEAEMDMESDGDPLNKALMEAAQWKDVAHRTAAELENYRKRMAREMQDSMRYATAGLLESLLPVLDNFDYGMQAAKAESGGSNLYVGLSMVLRQIQDFLKDNAVEEISGVGTKFDPNIHEAVSLQASDSVAEGVILQQMRKGYKLRERLLRPASVIVSSGPAKADARAAE